MRSGESGRRFWKSLTVTKPKTKPPMWAKNATPPPASGCAIEALPSSSWNPNQIPRKSTAGTSRRMKTISVSTFAFGSSRR